MDILEKSGSRIADTLDFVIATSATDRANDIIDVAGLHTKSFEGNPVALYMHNHDEPVGVWTNIRRSANAMIATLQFAAAGTSRLVDFTRSLVDQGVLKAASVSVQPIRFTANKSGRGRVIHESDLVEVSLVTVPMNPEALLIAKSFEFSEAEIEQFLGQSTTVKCDPQLRQHQINIMKARIGLHR